MEFWWVSVLKLFLNFNTETKPKFKNNMHKIYTKMMCYDCNKNMIINAPRAKINFKCVTSSYRMSG